MVQIDKKLLKRRWILVPRVAHIVITPEKLELIHRTAAVLPSHRPPDEQASTKTHGYAARAARLGFGWSCVVRRCLGRASMKFVPRPTHAGLSCSATSIHERTAKKLKYPAYVEVLEKEGVLLEVLLVSALPPRRKNQCSHAARAARLGFGWGCVVRRSLGRLRVSRLTLKHPRRRKNIV